MHAIAKYFNVFIIYLILFNVFSSDSQSHFATFGAARRATSLNVASMNFRLVSERLLGSSLWCCAMLSFTLFTRSLLFSNSAIRSRRSVGVSFTMLPANELSKKLPAFSISAPYAFPSPSRFYAAQFLYTVLVSRLRESRCLRPDLYRAIIAASEGGRASLSGKPPEPFIDSEMRCIP